MGNMLGCCAIALWNYCVAAEAAAIAYAMSRCWRAILREHSRATLLCGTHRQPVRSQRSLQYYQLRLVFVTLASLLLLLFWRQ